MKGRQRSLFDMWSRSGCTSPSKKQKESHTSANEDEGLEARVDYNHDKQRAPICESPECEDEGLTLAHCSKQPPVMNPVNVRNDCSCTSPCCSIERESETYQPKERAILSSFVKNGHKFLPAWYERYEWIMFCTTQKKVFCVSCRFAHRHNLLFLPRRELKPLLWKDLTTSRSQLKSSRSMKSQPLTWRQKWSGVALTIFHKRTN